MRLIAAFIVLVMAIALPVCAQESSPARPPAGDVAIMKSSEVRPGMKGTAWTVFAGTEPEAVPVEIIGAMKNAWGPKQDIILAKMGGKAIRTNVAGGMSGSPVYVDGKLIGAVSLRMSVFSPDAICGITPIELMLEIEEFDASRPVAARAPDRVPSREQVSVPGSLLRHAVSAGSPAGAFGQPLTMVPIESPVTFSGFHEDALREFAPVFRQMGVAVAQGGAGASLSSRELSTGWRESLRPGDAVTGVLVSGDMGMTVMGTVTHNDGRRVLAFGHPFLNLGPVSMPMARGEVLMTLASAFQPNKFGNATGVVGAFRQDRHSGVMGMLGEQSPSIPVKVTTRSFGDGGKVVKQRELNFQIFVQQKWTPFLMMVTLFNALSGLNDFADEATYRLSGEVELDGQQNISLSTILAPGEMPVPAPMLLAGWYGDKFNRLFLNAVKTPSLKSVNVTVDLLPERRVATIENAWAELSEAPPGASVPVKVFLRPYRGERVEREFEVRIPAGLARGEHRILLSDADTLNRLQNAAAKMNRYIDLRETVALLNKERNNDRLYVSLVESRPTLYYDDKAMPSLPASIANVMQNGRGGNRAFLTSGESAQEQMSLPFEFQVSGSYSLRIKVK